MLRGRTRRNTSLVERSVDRCEHGGALSCVLHIWKVKFVGVVYTIVAKQKRFPSGQSKNIVYACYIKP